MCLGRIGWNCKIGVVDVLTGDMTPCVIRVPFMLRRIEEAHIKLEA